MATSTKRYKVVGEKPVFGHAPGSTFEASLDKGSEEFLVGIGALRVIESKKKD